MSESDRPLFVPPKVYFITFKIVYYMLYVNMSVLKLPQASQTAIKPKVLKTTLLYLKNTSFACLELSQLILKLSALCLAIEKLSVTNMATLYHS